MSDWHLWVSALAGLLAMLAVVPYIRDMVRGTTRPSVVSWALWVLLLLIAFLAQLSAGASWSIVFLAGDLLGTSLVLVLCLVGYGYEEYGWLDGVCLMLAIFAIALWQVTALPVAAIVCALVADFCASLPTLAKAYCDPASEHPLQFFVLALAALLGVVATTTFDAANLLTPLYLLAINGTIGAVAYLRA